MIQNVTRKTLQVLSRNNEEKINSDKQHDYVYINYAHTHTKLVIH